jgi:hypothetical protein
MKDFLRKVLPLISLCVALIALGGSIISANFAYQGFLVAEQNLEEAKQFLSMLEMQEKAPAILVTCEETKPVVDINILYETTNLWLEMESPSGQSAVFTIYDWVPIGDLIHLVGGAGNMRGSNYLIFSPGEYILRGWIHPLGNDKPPFNPSELFFETTFVVPKCGG